MDKHDYLMTFPFDERPLLPAYRCRHCGDVQMSPDLALKRQNRWCSPRLALASLLFYVGGIGLFVGFAVRWWLG